MIKDTFRILIEPEQEELNAALKTINEIEEILDKHKIEIPRLLHGFNKTAWEILKVAKLKGYDSRIGMEDTIYLENGKKAESNLEIINYAREILKLR